MLSKLTFASFLAYSPRGVEEVSTRSRSILLKIKRDEFHPTTGPVLAYAVRRMKEVAPPFCASFLDAESTLVPIPNSAPTREGGLWVAQRICDELLQQGFGGNFSPCLERVLRVGKAAWSPHDLRPTPAEHFDSFRVRTELYSPRRITLVDDVVTQGSTALAAASRLAIAFPTAEIRLFALVRTRGLIPEIEAIVEPTVGEIELRSDRAWRSAP